jgi:exopolysaccharide biosynthesis polyprenyl glycosylphosphotransferase
MKNPKHKYFLVLVDWIVLMYSFLLSMKLSTKIDVDIFFTIPPFIIPDIILFFLYSIIILFIFNVSRLYQIQIYITITEQLQAIMLSLIISVLGLALLSFFTKSIIIFESRLIVFSFFLISLTLLVVLRIFIFRTIFRYNILSLIPYRRILIFGVEENGIKLATQLKKKNHIGLEVVGFIDDKIPVGTSVVNGYKVVGNIADDEKIIASMDIDEVIFCFENLPEQHYLELIEKYARTKARVLIAANQFGVIPKYVQEEYYGNIPVVSVLNNPPYFGWAFLKRFLDVFFALMGLIILSPLLITVAVAIKLSSKGPIFYRQTRLGKGGRPFTFYKFRSMYVGSDRDESRPERIKRFIKDGDNGNTSSTKIVDETNITMIGRFIRKTSIDELPQLINVFKGDMSLVGPRPCLPYEWEIYNDWHKKRLSVTPGCTGIWQVSARSEVGFHEMVLLDMYYVYNISLHLDIWVMLKTIPVMLFGTGGK